MKHTDAKPPITVGVKPYIIWLRQVIPSGLSLFLMGGPFAYYVWRLLSGRGPDEYTMVMMFVGIVGYLGIRVMIKASERRIRREVEAADCLVCPICASPLTAVLKAALCATCRATLNIEEVQRVWRRWFRKDIGLIGSSDRAETSSSPTDE